MFLSHLVNFIFKTYKQDQTLRVGEINQDLQCHASICFWQMMTNVTCVKCCDALWSPWNRPHEAALQAKPGQRVAALLETHVAHVHRGSVQNQLNIGEVQLGCQDERNKTKRKLLASLRTRENSQTFQASCTSSIATKAISYQPPGLWPYSQKNWTMSWILYI